MSELIETLPKLLRQVAQEFDIDTAMQLAQWRGGRGLYVPVKMTARHPIAKAIGVDAARWLANEYPGENILVERAANTLRHMRDQEICSRSDQGESLDALAGAYNTTQRTILRIIHRGSIDPTPDLFS